MGFAISWVGVESNSKQAFLEKLKCEETEEIDACNEFPLTIASRPTGSSILWSNSFLFPSRKQLKKISTEINLLHCQIEEHLMHSSAAMIEGGQEKWTLLHSSEQGLLHLDASGPVPSEFSDIKQHLLKLQEKEPPGSMGVDYIFDIPLEVAKSVCGFKHDEGKFEWGEPNFYRVRGPEKESLFRKLF